jgi:arsenite-transporting ATPase
MGVNETLRAHKSLLEFNLPVHSCLVNRLTPEFDHPFLAKRRDAELVRISELEDKLDSVEVASLELLDQEVIGIENLRNVGQTLYGTPEKINDSLGPHRIGELLKHDVHRGMVKESHEGIERIYLHFPGIKRDELSLRSNDGILYIGLNGREKEIETSVPVKASQVDAKLEGDVLRLDIPLE